MAYQSLYRRYRPRRFGEVVGQDHVVRALRNSVREDRVGHAYLFSGPRGTGKTSTARILAKALNCENLVDGEPCGECDPCRAIEAGVSYDLQELDAASNNKVEDVRDLVGRVALGSPGRTKVYILDEVHMLTTAASNALLKTLEEPPEHVKFVLATTDPHKVLPTIRSRTQHFEFTLLPADRLGAHVAHVIEDAGLEVDDATVQHVLRSGGGSARDTLSALEAAAAGGVTAGARPVDALLEALAATDPSAAIVGVAEAVAAGRDPRVLGEELLAALRDVFLVRMGAVVDHLAEAERARMQAWADRMTDRATTRALEQVGEALLEMRQAPDPRIPLEVALVRLTRPPAAGTLEALAERLDRIEARLAGGSGPVDAGAVRAPVDAPAGGREPAPPSNGGNLAPATTGGVPTTVDRHEAATAPGPTTDGDDAPAPRGPASARAALAQQRGAAPARGVPPPATPSSAAPRPPRPPRAGEAGRPAAGGSGPSGGAAATVAPAGVQPAAVPPAAASATGDATEPPGAGAPTGATSSAAPSTPLTREDLTIAWADAVLPRLGGLAKAMYGIGRFLEVSDGTAVFALPNEAHRRKCEQKRAEVESALREQLGRPVTLRLVVDDGRAGGRAPDPSAGEAPPPELDDDLDTIDVRELEDSTAEPRTGIDRLTEAFPGAQLLDTDDVP